MPSRVIRGEINGSDSLSRVSIEADLTFRALIVAVDDFGRTDARPAALKAALFPMREDVSPAMVLLWVKELTCGEDPPVLLYKSGGRPYLALTGWEKHRGKGRRAAESKFPQPPENTGVREIRGDPGKSEDCHADPPEGRGTRDGGREASDEGREKAVAFVVVSQWESVKGAAAAYGKRWNCAKPSKAREALLRARFGEYQGDFGDDCLVLVVHGYMAFHRRSDGSYDVMKYLTPETLFRASNCGKYLDAYAEATEQGLIPPFQREAPLASGHDAQRLAARDQTLTKFLEDNIDDPAADSRIAPSPAVRRVPVGGSG